MRERERGGDRAREIWIEREREGGRGEMKAERDGETAKE